MPDPPDTRAGLLRDIQRLQADMNRLQAAQYQAIREFTRTAEEPATVARELALGLAITTRRAESHVHLAEALVVRLPETLKAMERGAIDAHKASRIAEPTATLSDAQAREVDVIMATRLAGKDPTGLRRSTNLAVAKVDPDGHARRCERRRAERKVKLTHLDDGMVQLSGDLPAELGVAAYSRINSEARRRCKCDKSKTLDQHRADVYAELLLKDKSGVTVGPKAEVFVYLDFYTWLNLNTKPAEMAGAGIIPAWLANEIADGTNTTLRRLITDPDDGQILSVGRHSYRPPAALARLAYARDRECRSPGCYRPAQACELDHVQEWHANNGETAHDNLATFCTRDHHLKDQPGWSYTMDKDTGEITITTPTGDEYTSTPEPLHQPRNNPLPNDKSEAPTGMLPGFNQSSQHRANRRPRRAGH